MADWEGALPPIVVHGPTMRVIDGMHRLKSAIAAGREKIEAKVYDGDERDAFVLAVRLNVTHGLPLTRADRTAAVARIVASHPHWSNRMIATVTGTAPGTVAEIRRRSSGQDGQLVSRMGQDGRVRPLDHAAGRELASRLLAEHPGASLRQVARAAGISPATVQDVRRRMNDGQDPVPPRQRRRQEAVADERIPRPRRPSSPPASDHHRELTAMLADLRRDPAIRFSEKGRSLLRWLDGHVTGMTAWEQVVRETPEHSLAALAKLVRTYAAAWTEFAVHIERNLA